MSKYDPPRAELWFRLAFSIVGLAMMGFAITYRGVSGVAWVEIVMFAGAFFGGTAAWTLWKLFRGNAQ